MPGDFPTLGGNDNVGKPGSDTGNNKKSYKDVAESGINRLGDSPQIWTRQLLSDQEWSQGVSSVDSESSKWQTFKEVGQALLEHDKYVKSLLLNTVTQWLNMLPAFVMNEIRIGSTSGNDATTSQEPDRHTSPASPGSDIPQEWGKSSYIKKSKQ